MKKVLVVIYIILILILLKSIIHSGYNYRFDNDELYHLQKVYLLSNGFKPYSQFYTVYAPFLHLLLVPIFKISGFDLKTIYYAKIVMIILYLLRVGLMTIFTKSIFGNKAALLFLPLMLFEPFSLLTSMQVRPENFALLILIITYLLAIHALKKESFWRIFSVGLFTGLALISSIKLMPSILIIALGLPVYFLYSKKKRWAFVFVDGFIMTFLLLFFYLFTNGNLIPGFQQLFLDPWLLNSTISTSTPLNYFYIFESSLLYGQLGKPITWIFAMILPVLAFAGSYRMLVAGLNNGSDRLKRIFYIGLPLIFYTTWISMLFINSVWLQYYLPLTWMYCLFSAYLITDIWTNHRLPLAFRKIFVLGTIIFLLGVYITTFKGNYLRAEGSSTPELITASSLWNTTPNNRPTFANLLFRRPAYPIIYGGTLSPYMIQRFGPIYKSLEKNHLTIIYADDNFINQLDMASQIYIRENYKPDVLNPIIRRKITTSN